MQIQCSGKRRLIIVDIFISDRRFADPRERRGQSVREFEFASEALNPNRARMPYNRLLCWRPASPLRWHQSNSANGQSAEPGHNYYSCASVCNASPSRHESAYKWSQSCRCAATQIQLSSAPFDRPVARFRVVWTWEEGESHA